METTRDARNWTVWVSQLLMLVHNLRAQPPTASERPHTSKPMSIPWNIDLSDDEIEQEMYRGRS